MTREAIQILLAFSIGFAGAFAFRYSVYPILLYVWRRLPQHNPRHHHH